VAANVAFANEPLALRTIMKSLGEHMQTVADGIAREDWELVERTAPLIAEHPQPPLSEKMRIMGFVGTHMAKYKSYDSETHDSARALGVAARARDGLGTIIAFQQLQASCYDCHREFRKQFVEYFYGKED
jgi:cytochrome c556